MLLEEFLPDNLKQEETKENQTQIQRQDSDDVKIIKTKYSDSEDGKNNSETSSNESRNAESPGSVSETGRIGTKTVLPFELEELVREALAEINSAG